MKVTIVGGSGVVGSSAAFRLAQDGKATEVILFDVRRNLAEAHALDIEQAIVHRAASRVSAGDVEETKGSDVIVMTASVPKHDVELSRREYLGVNLPLVLDMMRPLVARSPSAVWIIATSPVDPLVFLIHRTFSLPRGRVIGLNRNDTSRFLWAIARTLSIPSTEVEAFVLGEHGDSQVPLFSSIRVRGKPVSLKREIANRIRAEMSGFFRRWNELQPGRTAGWTSAESLGDIISTIALSDDRIWPCSTTLEGEYGQAGVSMGVPVLLGPKGVRGIIELPLTSAERKALDASADSIRDMIREGERLLKDRPESNGT